MPKPRRLGVLLVAAGAGAAVSAGLHAASLAGLRADARTAMPLLVLLLAGALGVFMPCAVVYSRMLKTLGFVGTWGALLGHMAWWAIAALAAACLSPVAFAVLTAGELERAGPGFDLDGLAVRGMSTIAFVLFAASAAFLQARMRTDAEAEPEAEAKARTQSGGDEDAAPGPPER